MPEYARLKGIIAAVPTPLREDFGVDQDRLIEFCAFLLGPVGCDGINLLGTTGEATSLSTDERLAIMRRVANSGLPLSQIMVGTGAAAFSDAVTLSRSAMELGFAGALLLPPFYYKGIGSEGITTFVTNVIRRVGANGFRLYLYNFPQNTGLSYDVEVIDRLRQAFPSCLLGLKDSSGVLDNSATIARSFRDFDVFPSAEASLSRADELGFAGIISATANITGRFAQKAWNERGPEARAALDHAVALRAVISQFPLVASVKAAVAIRTGQPLWRETMPPLTALSNDQYAALEAGLRGCQEPGAA